MAQPLYPGDPHRLGEYEVVGRLGEGGMGTVFLGRAPDGRPVAIKVVRREFAADAEYAGRFRSEVNRAREVPPFSTAEVLGADPDHDPPYLVVEYVDGPSLATVIREQGPLHGSQLQSVAVGIATALTAIHGARVIHRDLKPQNVLVARGGLKVIDFGIARPVEATSLHTATDQMVGTVAYMAPERFEPAHEVTVGFPADIWAWGAVVAYAATGRTPFAADSAPGTAMRILTKPPNLDGLPEPLRSTVERSLAKDPADRPTARQLLDLLLAGGPAGPAAPPTGRMPVGYEPQPTIAPRSGRRGRRWALAAVAVLLLAAGGFYASHEFNAGNAGETTAAPSAGPSSAAPPAPSATPASPAAPTGLPAILTGRRRILLHLSNVDRDLALPQNAKATAGGGTTPESLFRLVPAGKQFQVRSEVPDLAGADRCLSVRPDRNAGATLMPAACEPSDETLFAFTPTDQTDEKNRPTYTMSSEEYGIVQWSDTNHKVYVEQAGDFPASIEFSFVDRGPAT